MPDNDDDQTNADLKSTKALADDVHWITHATFWSQIGLGIIGIIALVIYHGQLEEMRKATIAATGATKAAVWSAYWSCLSSQAAENAYAQSRSGADDSHAMAVASIQQAAAGMQSERSSILFLPRTANPGENVGQTFGLVIEAKNIGKGDARDMAIKYWAVLLKNTDTLRFDQPPKQQLGLRILSFPAGYTFPEKAEPPHGQLFQIAPLRDANRNLVPIGSPDAADLMNGGSTTAYVYGSMTYSDIAGHHAERFCHEIWLMNGNTQRSGGMNENERRCLKYLRADPQYTYKPLAQPQPSGNTVASQIACVKPKD